MWRVTYVDGGAAVLTTASPAFVAVPGAIFPGLQGAQVFQAPARTEIRDEKGHILRLAQGARFEIFEALTGPATQVFGEHFIKNNNDLMHHKYPTSCWVCGKIAGTIGDVLCKPADQPNTDEFFSVTGCVSIFEFDERNHPYVICSLSEGEKATMVYSPNALGRSRYSATISAISDAEYQYIVDSYLDPRRWL